MEYGTQFSDRVYLQPHIVCMCEAENCAYKQENIFDKLHILNFPEGRKPIDPKGLQSQRASAQI